MAKCKCSKCGSTRIVSNIVQNMPNGCFDVCTNPICGSPDELSILAPLIYDEIGINPVSYTHLTLPTTPYV